MLIPTLILVVLAVILVIVGYSRGGGVHTKGLGIAFTMTWQVLPLLLAAFIVAGMVQVLVPNEMLAKWVGAESGMRGILLGTIAGGFTPGGPYVSLPLVAGLMGAGASIGTVVAYLTAWSLWAIGRLPMEFAILGWRVTVIRLICTFFFPPIAGLLALAVARFVK